MQNSLIRPFETGQVLCRQDHTDRTLYLIIQGEVEVSSVTDGRTSSLGKLGAGELVGEVSLLFMMPRIATVTAAQPSVVLEIPSEVFSTLLDENQLLENAVVKHCKDRVIETSLRSVPVFNELDKQSLSELCYLSSLVKAEKNAIVAHEGKTERSMFVVCNGTARVYINVDGKEITVALLHPGDYFGEYSLFTGKARTASVSALTDLHLVVLEGEALFSFAEYNEETEREINQNALQRKQDLNKIRMGDGLLARQAAETSLNQVQDMLSQ